MNRCWPSSRREIAADGEGVRERWLPLVVLLLSLTLSIVVVALADSARIAKLRLDAATAADSYAVTLRARILGQASAAYALAAVVEQGGGQVAAFDQLALQILPNYKGADALILAPDGVIRSVAPLRSHETLLGTPLIPADRPLASDGLQHSRSGVTLSAPFEHAGGGKALIARHPVFLPTPNGERPWGYTAVVIHLDDRKPVSGAGRSDSLVAYHVRISLLSADTTVEKLVAASPEARWSDPIRRELAVADGKLLLDIEPRDGWRDHFRLVAEILLAIGLSAMLAWQVQVGMRLPRMLRRRVAERTAELQEAVRGLNAEIEDHKLARQQLSKLSTAIEQSPSSIVITDTDARIEYVNPRFCELSGYPSSEAIGQTPRMLQSGLTPPERYADLWRTLKSGGVWKGEFLNRRKDGSLFWEHQVIAPIVDAAGDTTHFIAVKEDISARKAAEERLQRSNRELAMLSRCIAQLVRSSTEQDLLDDVCRIIVEVGRFPFAWVALRDGPTPDSSFLPVAHCLLPSLGTVLDFTEFKCELARDPVVQVLASGTAAIEADLRADVECPACGLWRAQAVKLGCASRIVLPLQIGGALYGVLSVYADKASQFDESERRLLGELADHLGYGIGARREALLRSEAENALRMRDRAMEASFNAIFISRWTGQGYEIVYANSAYERLTGYTRAEVLGRDPYFLLKDDLDQLGVEQLREARRTRSPAVVTLRCYRKDASPVWCELSVAPVQDAHGKTSHAVNVVNDITERKRFEEQIQHQANHDALTGLPNRNLFDDRMRQEIIRAERNARSVAILLLDLDNFKLINDSRSHGAGDQLLQQVAARLLATVREGDTVARIGGDEFGIVLADMGRDVDVGAIVAKLLQTGTMAYSVAGEELFASASIGVTVFPADGDTAEALMRGADIALFRAKRLGRGQSCRFEHDMTADVSSRVALEGELRRAIAEREFCLHYQPKVDLISGEISGSEALIRWNHPQRGLVPPNDFIPVAEESGLVIAIGEWVAEECCRQIAQWRSQGIAPLPVAINLSACQFGDAQLSERLGAILKRHGIAAGLLEVEITEGMLMTRPELAVATLKRLKQIGLKIALDDFGTGYSSLAYLKRFPINHLKIDRSFVRDITENPEDAAITLAVIAMAHSLGIKVVAEGVESEGQFRYLRKHHCDQLQGYLFSRPLPADLFANMLRERPRLKLESTAVSASDTRRLLLVDDEENVLSALRRLLRREDYTVLCASSARQALELLAVNDVQVVMADQRMPQVSGAEFLRRVKQLYPDTVRIILSGYSELAAMTDAINQGAIFKFLSKPWDDDDLRDQIRSAFELHASRSIGETSTDTPTKIAAKPRRATAHRP